MSRVTFSTAQKRAAREAFRKFLSVLLVVAMVLQTSPLAYATAGENAATTDAVVETVTPDDPVEPEVTPTEEPAAPADPAPVDPEPEPAEVVEPAEPSEPVTPEEPAATVEDEPTDVTPVEDPVVPEDTTTTEPTTTEPTTTEPTTTEPTTTEPATSDEQEKATLSVYVENATLTINGQKLTSAGNVEVPAGEDITFTVTAAKGYELKSDSVKLTVDGSDSELGASGSYTIYADQVKTGTGIMVVASKLDTKTVYKYEDKYVSVVATLDKGSAIPDNATLSVTPITADSTYYNYDAYMEALNNRVEGEKYDEQNTLLYDVAFLWVDPETGKTVELQPEEGAVTVKFSFKKHQLSDGIQAGAAENVEVNHLPLVDSAKADTTYESTNIDATDVVVEPMATNTSGSDTVEVRTDNFSVFAFSYTVNFTYDDYTYSIAGESEILLSALLAQLGIDVNVADVANVTFSNSEFVAVEQVEGDWKLTSLKAFNTEETLIIDLANGDKYIITVTDDVDGTNLAPYVTSWDMYYKETSTGQWLPYTGQTLENGWYLRADCTYSIPEDVVTPDNRVVYYQSPAGYNIPEEVTNNLYDNDGNVIGTIHVGTDGLVTLTYNEAFATGESIEGNFSYWGVIDIQTSEEYYDLDFEGEGGEIHIHVDHPEEEDINVKKTNSGLTLEQDGNYHTTFTVEVSTSKGTSTGDDTITVTDTATLSNTTNYPFSFTTPTVKKVLADATEITVPSTSYTYTTEGNNWTITGLPKLEAGEKYVIVYDATVTDDVQSSTGVSQTVTNNVTAQSDELTASGSNKLTIAKEIAKTYSGPDANNTVTWTVTINPNRQNIENCWFTEQMSGNMYLVSDVTITTELSGYTARTITLASLQEAQGTTNVQHFEYQFLKGAKPNWPNQSGTGISPLDRKFTITYKTRGQGDNTAGFSFGGFDYTITKSGPGPIGMPNTTKAQAYTPVIEPSAKRLKYDWRPYLYKLPTTLEAEHEYVITDSLSQVTVKDSEGNTLFTAPQYTYLGYWGPHGENDPLREYTVKYFLHNNFDIITPEGRYRYTTTSGVPTHVYFSPSSASGSYTATEDMTINVIGIDLDGHETTDATTKIKGFKIVITPHKNITVNRCLSNAGSNSGRYYTSYIDYEGHEDIIGAINAAAKNSLQSGSGTGFSSTVTSTYESNGVTTKYGSIRKANGHIYIDYTANIDRDQVLANGNDAIVVVDQRSSLQDGGYGTLITSGDYKPKLQIATTSGTGNSYTTVTGAGYFSYTRDDSTGTVRFTLKNMQNLFNNNPTYKYVRFKYSIQVDLDPFWESSANNEKTYTNVIGVENGIGLTASKSVTVHRETDALDKNGHQELDDHGTETVYVRYDVYINKDAENLDPDSDTITLHDTVTITSTPQVSNDQVIFKDSELKLFLYDPDAEDHRGAQVTEGWGYTFDPETQTLTVTLNDETAYVLAYCYDVSPLYQSLGNGMSYTLTNSADLYGKYTKIVNEEYQLADAIGQSIHRLIHYHKVDKDNYNVKIEGATFKLENYVDGTWTTVGTYVTDENGDFTFDIDTLHLGVDTLYRLTELTTKDGYFIVDVNGNPIVHNFIIKNKNQTDADALAATAHPDDFTPTTSNCTLFSYGGGNVYIENEEIPEIDIPVEKIWNDSVNPNVAHPGSIEVELLQNGQPMSPAKKLTLNDGNDWKGTFTKLPKFDNQRNEYTYTINEISKPAGYASAAISGSETAGFTVTNTPYEPVTVQIPVKKILQGREWKTGDAFTFTLAAISGAPLPTTTAGRRVIIRNTTPDYTGKFGVITYSKAGTYKYTVKETKGSLGGVTYSTETKTVTITVVENPTTGKLQVSTDTPILTQEFTNTYDATGTAKLEAIKEVTGSAWPANAKAIFEVTAAANTPMPENTRVELTAAGTADFGNITYSLADAGKTYTYTITETPSGFGEGWTGSGTITATVVVGADKGDGTLEDCVVTYSPEDHKIVNSYTADGSAQLNAKKTGENLGDRTFEFELLNSEGTVIQTSAAVKQGQTANFEPIKYKLSDLGGADYKEFTYQIREKLPEGVDETHKTKDGVTYDTHVETVTVRVTNNHAGKLVVTYDGEPTFATPAFENDYEAKGSAQLSALKAANASLGDRTFQFELLDASGAVIETSAAVKQGEKATFTTINYTLANLEGAASKEFTYQIREKLPSGVTAANPKKDGVTYDTHVETVVVKVTDNGKGALVVTYNGNNEFTTPAFENKYEAKGSAQLSALKAANANLGDRTFQFELLNDKDEVIETSAAVKQGQTANFTAIQYKLEDLGGADSKDYTYKIREKLPEGVTAANPKKDGVTYDTHVETVVVKVTDNGKGALVVTYNGNNEFTTPAFDNNYAATGSAEFSAKKTGENLGDRTFQFELLDGEGTVIETSDPIKQGTTWNFETIEYTLADLNGAASKEFTYQIREKLPEGVDAQNPKKDGVTYDTHVETVTVKVTDNGNGALVVTYNGDPSFTTAEFNNTYGASGSAQLNAKKTGANLGDRTFQFELLNDKDEVIQTSAAVKQGQTANFKAIQYKLEDLGGADSKDYTYKIREKLPEGVDETHKTKDGVTYDTTVKTVKVTVTNNGTGDLVVTYDGKPTFATPAFENIYDANGTGTIEVVKNFTGREWTNDDVFEFTLTAKTDGAPMPTKDTTVTITKADAPEYKKAFGEIAYGLADAGKTYEYTITETHKGDTINGITYESNDYVATVKVSDNGDGTLKVETTYGQGNTFTNTYGSKGEGEILVQKVLQNREWTDDDSFQFRISAATGTPLPGAKSITITKADAASNYTKSFGKITFTEAGIYTYTITEVHAGETINGVHYDENTHTVTIKAVDDGTGNIIAAPDSSLIQTTKVTNTYDAKGTGSIEVKKNFTGREWTNDDVFEFTLTAKTDGAPMPTKDTTVTITKADAPEYKKAFGEIAYGLDDRGKTYEYTITETKGTAGGVTYDSTTRSAIVKITDKGNGELDVQVTYGTGENVFNNTYDAKGEAVLFATKTLTIIGETTKKLEAGDFSFKLEEVEGLHLPDAGVTRSNDADGKVAFPAIEYKLEELDWNADKTARVATDFHYTIKEIVPADAVNEAGEKYSEAADKTGVFMLDGVYYSEQKQDLTITVSDNGDGTLGIKYNGKDTFEGFDFTNEYFEATAHVEFDKLYYGEGGEFTFRMTPAKADGTPAEGTSLADMSATKLVYSDLQHLQWNETIPSGVQTTVTSRNVTFEKVGTYYYLISEIDSNDNIDYDEATLLATIVVDKDAKATVTYKLSKYAGAPFEDIEDADALFYNNGLVTMGFRSAAMRHTNNSEKLATFQPEIRKVLENGTLQKDEFSFSIYAGDTATGTPLETVTNDENGLVRFSVIRYDLPKSDNDENIYTQTYTYTIVENAGDNPTIVYSQEQIKLTVTVAESTENNDLVATGVYTQGGQEVTVPTITNHYDTIKIHATKYSREDLENGIKTPLVGAHYGLWMVNPDGDDVYLGNQTSDEGGNLYYDIPTVEGNVYYFKEEYEPPKGHLVDPYPTDYFTLVIGENSFSLKYFASYDEAIGYIAGA